MRPASADQRGRGIRVPLEEARAEGLSRLRRAQFPGLLALIDLRLVIFGLVAGQVGEDAGESDLDQCARTVGPLELAEEVLGERGVGLILVDARSGICFGGQHRVIAADFGIAIDKILQFEDLRGRCSAEIIVDVDIENLARSIEAYCYQRLQGWDAFEVAAGHTLNL